jgi:hypothetical protein
VWGEAAEAEVGPQLHRNSRISDFGLRAGLERHDREALVELLRDHVRRG